MRLSTARLEIRLPHLGEGVRLAGYYRDNREFLQPFYPRFTPEDFDAGSWEQTIPHVYSEFEARRSIRTCLLYEGRLAGVVNISHAMQSPRFSATLGYSLAEQCVGLGLMREALTALIPYAFERLRLHRLEANYMPRNERSAKTLAAVGFVKEGLAQKYLLINGVWEDHVLTAKINPGWR